MDENLFDTTFVDVILPVPIPGLFTYRVPKDWEKYAIIGARVVVEFGKGRILTAVIAKVHDMPPSQYKAKYLQEILDNRASVTPTQLWLFQWVADYYMCSVGEVMNMALPAGLKINSQSKIQLHPNFERFEDLEAIELQIVESLKLVDALSFDEVANLINTKEVSPILKKLVAKHAIIIFEEISEKYKPKVEKRIKLKRVYEGSEEVLGLIDSLEKTPKQQEILLRYLSHISIQDLRLKNNEGIVKAVLMQDGLSESSLKTLMKNGVFEDYEQIVSRFADLPEPTGEIYLSEKQQETADAIMRAMAEKSTVLFRGITGSGKTEIYVDIVQQVINSGSQVLLLLPEIALTTQIVSRLRKVFGKGLGIYHSKFSDNERVEVWNGVLDGSINFVVGVRSSIFLPFQQLGLIIVDEEHEPSYKQFDPAPRYHARDVAIVLALKTGARVLLGSATPSLESYFQAKNNKFGLVELLERFGDAELPQIGLVNLVNERKEKTIEKDFSAQLLNALRTNLERKEQSIIFLNRRGYAPYLNCQTCNWIGTCDQCAVSLTYHMGQKNLVCHYCGHNVAAPRLCPVCSSPGIKAMGTGTEKIEDDLRDLLPEARVARMDLDTTKTKNAYLDIIGAFEKGEIDILVGTQMLSKGLDFDGVTLVGVFNADKMIHFPDFRSPERAFQLITQVSGRSGRRNNAGKVLIQTASPDNRILQYIVNNDYESFYTDEIIDREAYNYPPYTRLIEIIIKDVSQEVAHKAAAVLAESISNYLGKDRVLGPEKALVERVRNKYVFEIWIKLEKEKINMAATKTFLLNEKINVMAQKAFKSVQIIFNVDAI
jgi:primosomal protein N' (replication factor Y) (superfamily II helicase)